VLSGNPNETTEKHEAKADANSPDGVRYYCHFDFERMKGDSQSLAMAHVGMNIATSAIPKPEPIQAALTSSSFVLGLLPC